MSSQEPDLLQLSQAIAALIRRLFNGVPQAFGFRNTPAAQSVAQRVLHLSGNFSSSQLQQLRDDLKAAILPQPGTGVPIGRPELLNRIQSNLNVGRARSVNIARTETTASYNRGRLQSYRRSQLVTHVRFFAIDDTRTTDICRTRNGMVIPIEDVEIIRVNTPPLHFQCRSVLSPTMVVVNEEHAKAAADPKNNPENRDLAPLLDGWLTSQVVSKATLLQDVLATSLEDIEAAMDGVSDPTEERMALALESATQALVAQALPLVEAGDLAGIDAMDWGLQDELSDAIAALWEEAWSVGGQQGWSDVQQSVPAGLVKEALTEQVLSLPIVDGELFASRDPLESGLLRVINGTYGDGATGIESWDLSGDTFTGVFLDRIDARRVKRYEFEIDSEEVSFKLLNPDQVNRFSLEDAELTLLAKGKGKGKGKKKNCIRGTACGNSCISGKKTCTVGMTAAQKKQHKANVKKAGAQGASKTEVEPKGEGRTVPKKVAFDRGAPVPHGEFNIEAGSRNVPPGSQSASPVREILPKVGDDLELGGESYLSRLASPPHGDGVNVLVRGRTATVSQKIKTDGGVDLDVSYTIILSIPSTDLDVPPGSRASETSLKAAFPNASVRDGLVQWDWSPSRGQKNADGSPVRVELSRRDRFSIARTAQRLWAQSIGPNLPEGMVLSNIPDGGPGEARDRAYQRMGFGRAARSSNEFASVQHALVQNGKLRPLQIYEPDPKS